MKHLKSTISSNLLSLSGYAFILCVLWILFYVYPQEIAESLKNGPVDNFEITVGCFLLIAQIIKTFLIVEIILLILVFYETKSRLNIKIAIKTPYLIKKIHSVFFPIGFLLAFIPLIIFALFIISLVFEFIFL